MISAEELRVSLLQIIITYLHPFVVDRSDQVRQLYFRLSGDLSQMSEKEKRLFNMAFKALDPDQTQFYYDQNYVNRKTGVTFSMLRLLEEMERGPEPGGRLIQGHEPNRRNIPKNILNYTKHTSLHLLARIAEVNENNKHQLQYVQRQVAEKENNDWTNLAKLADINNQLGQPCRNNNLTTLPSVRSPVPRTIKSAPVQPSFMRPTANSQARLSTKSVGRGSRVSFAY